MLKSRDYWSRHDRKPGYRSLFYVHPGLHCDVILGRDLLEDIKACDLYPEAFTPVAKIEDGENSPFEFYIVIRPGSVPFTLPISRRKLENIAAGTSSAEDIHDDERHVEMYRRTIREEEIALLPESEQVLAKRMGDARTGV